MASQGASKKILDKAQKDLAVAKPETILKLPLAVIHANPDQPRKYFDPTELNALAESMKELGDVEDPIKIVIRKKKKNLFALLMDGERRFRAARMVGLQEMSCHVKEDMPDEKLYEKSFLMNGCREDMQPLEKAIGIARIMRSRKCTQTEVARLMGVSQVTIGNLLKLLDLHQDLQVLLAEKKLDTGWAMAIAAYPKSKQMEILVELRKIAAKRRGGKITPNDISRLTKGVAEKIGAPRKKPKKTNPENILSHTQLVMRRTLQKIGELGDILSELAEIPVHKLRGEGIHFLDILDALRDIFTKIRSQIRRLSKEE